MPGKCVETEHHVMVRLIVLVIDEEKENTQKRVCCHCIVGQMWGSENQDCPGVNFINAKCGRLKCQIMASKCQKWHLTFMKFHRTLLALKCQK